MKLNFNEYVIQNILNQMADKNISKNQLSTMLNIEECMLLGYLNADFHLELPLIKSIAKLLEVPELALLESHDNPKLDIFESINEKQKYYKWLGKYKNQLKNQKVDFSNMSKKRIFNPNLAKS